MRDVYLDAFPPGTQLAGGWDELSIWGDRMARVDRNSDEGSFDPVRLARQYIVYLTDLSAEPVLLRARIDFKYGNKSIYEQPFYFRGRFRAETGQMQEPVAYWIPVKLADLTDREDNQLQRSLKERHFREAWKYPLSAPKWKKLMGMSYQEVDDAASLGGPIGHEEVNAIDSIAGPHSWDAVPGVFATTKKGRVKFIVSRQDAAKRKRNPPLSPELLEVLEQKFPVDYGYWAFDVRMKLEDDDELYGYVVPEHVGLKALPGERIVEIDPSKTRDGFTRAIFTPKPIPADKVAAFGLRPDHTALLPFVLEILDGEDTVALLRYDDRSQGVLIHKDTYPAAQRTHRGKVDEYRVTHFDKHGPSGHHNGTFEELLLEALRGGYQVMPPGGIDSIVELVG